MNVAGNLSTNNSLITPPSFSASKETQSPISAYLTCLLLTGVGILSLNAGVIYSLCTKFRRENNSQLAVLFSLSVADLIQGVDAVAIASLSMVIQQKYRATGRPPVGPPPKGPPTTALPLSVEIIHGILVDFLSKYLFSVSIVTLMVLAVIKMLTVTRNMQFSLTTLKKLSVTIWLVNLVLLGSDYVVYKMDVYTTEQMKYRLLWTTVLAFMTMFVFVACFIRILHTVRQANADVVGMPGQIIAPFVNRTFDGNLSRIAVSQVRVSCFIPPT